MIEIVFLVEDDPDGGYTAKALGESIFTEADDMETLRIMIRDAVHCHFPNEEKRPKIIRLHKNKSLGYSHLGRCQPFWLSSSLERSNNLDLP